MSTIKILQVSEVSRLAQTLLDSSPAFAVLYCENDGDFMISSTSLQDITRTIGALERIKFEMLINPILESEE